MEGDLDTSHAYFLLVPDITMFPAEPNGSIPGHLWRPNSGPTAFEPPRGGRPYPQCWAVDSLENDFHLDRTLQRRRNFAAPHRRASTHRLPIGDGQCRRC